MKVKNFNIETILSIIIDTCCYDKMSVLELAYFVYYNSEIEKFGLDALKDDLRDHLINIYPELGGIYYNKWDNPDLNSWIELQKEKFGDYLPVCRMGERLTEEKDKKTKVRKTYL